MSNKQTIKRKLNDAFVLAHNAQQPEYQDRLGRFFTPEKINEGMTLYTETKEADDKQKIAYGEQLRATRELNIESANARNYWMELVKMAKRALNNSESSIKDLGISGMRRTIFEEWIGEAEGFYNNALASTDILGRLNKFKIAEADLTAGLDMLTTLKPKNAEQEKKKSDAQRATLARNSLLEKLTQWCGDIVEGARIVFKDDLQILEAFKKKVYTPGYKKKKTTPTPTEPDPEGGETPATT
jgi:hypothetical protein